eukprot:gene11782-biopygen11975
MQVHVKDTSIDAGTLLYTSRARASRASPKQGRGGDEDAVSAAAFSAGGGDACAAVVAGAGAADGDAAAAGLALPVDGSMD